MFPLQGRKLAPDKTNTLLHQYKEVDRPLQANPFPGICRWQGDNRWADKNKPDTMLAVLLISIKMIAKNLANRKIAARNKVAVRH
jgi:hypothetical protein